MTTKAILTLAILLAVGTTVFAANAPVANANRSSANSFSDELGRDYKAAKGSESCNGTAGGSFADGPQNLIHPANYFKVKDNGAVARAAAKSII